MSYIKKNLLPDEKIIFATKKNYIVFLIPGVLLVLALFFLTNNNITSTLNAALQDIFRGTSFETLFSTIPVIIIGGIVIFTGLQQWLIYNISEYVITNKRVIMREGLIVRRVCDTRLSTISHVTVYQSLLGQLLNYGTVTINSFGGTQDTFIQVDKPNTFQKSVRLQLDQSRVPIS